MSEPLRQQRHALGFETIIIAGTGNYTCTINHRKQQASAWKKVLRFHPPTWGIDVPSCRVRASNPTFSSVVLFFFRKSTTRSYDLMNLSRQALRGAEIWHIWKQHHAIEGFWKVLKSVLHMRDMRLHGPGLYTGLFIKVLASLLAIRLQAHRAFSKCSITQSMRALSRDDDLRDVLAEHFHGLCPTT